LDHDETDCFEYDAAELGEEAEPHEVDFAEGGERYAEDDDEDVEEDFKFGVGDAKYIGGEEDGYWCTCLGFV
jgi:hypothetical protein